MLVSLFAAATSRSRRLGPPAAACGLVIIQVANQFASKCFNVGEFLGLSLGNKKYNRAL
jgi:hypothetical protein